MEQINSMPHDQVARAPRASWGNVTTLRNSRTTDHFGAKYDKRYHDDTL